MEVPNPAFLLDSKGVALMIINLATLEVRTGNYCGAMTTLSFLSPSFSHLLTTSQELAS